MATVDGDDTRQLRADNTCLAEELSSVAQQLVETQERLRQLSSQASPLGNVERTYIRSLDAADVQQRLRQLQPVLRRYNFAIAALDDARSSEPAVVQSQAAPKVQQLCTSFDARVPLPRGGSARPVGTDAVGSGTRLGSTAPSMGYYEVVLPNTGLATAQKGARGRKHEHSRFCYTDWKLRRVADARPGTTIDSSALVQWITEVEPRTPEDALPMFILCRDALKNVASGLVDLRTKRELELEEQVKELRVEERSLQQHVTELHAKCEHLQEMIQRYEKQTGSMQKLLDGYATNSSEQRLQRQLDESFIKNKQAEDRIRALTDSIAQMTGSMQEAERRHLSTIQGLQEAVTMPISAKVEAMSEAELLQHFVLVCRQPRMSWSRLGLELLAANVELTPIHALCKLFLERLKERAGSWVSELSSLLNTTPKDLPQQLTKWFEAESLLKLTPTLSKEIKDLARNVRKKDFVLIWDVLRQAVEAGTMEIADLLHHLGQSKEGVLKSWTGLEPPDFQRIVDNGHDFRRWIARKDVIDWRAQRRHDRTLYLGFLDLSTVTAFDAKAPPTGEMNTIISAILERKHFWDQACKSTGRPPLNLMRVTRAHFFHMYGARRAAERHLAQFLAGILMHKKRAALEGAENGALHHAFRLDEFENGHESMSSSPTQQHGGEHHHVSHRVLLFTSLLSLDDPAQWREQSSQFVLHVLFQVRDAVVRLRKLVQQRDRQAENTATVDDSSSLADIFGDCDFLVPVSEIIPIVQSEAVQAMLPEAAAQNVMPCFEASYESTVPVAERQLSMRGHELKKMLMDQEQASAFEESERARVEAHQTGLKDVVEGEPSNVWIDRFLYALSKRWHESNARLDEARKQQFCAFSQVGPQLCAHQSNIATEKLAVIATGHPRSNGSRRFCLSLERRGANPLRNGGGSYVYGVGRLGRASGRRGVASSAVAVRGRLGRQACTSCHVFFVPFTLACTRSYMHTSMHANAHTNS